LNVSITYFYDSIKNWGNQEWAIHSAHNTQYEEKKYTTQKTKMLSSTNPIKNRRNQEWIIHWAQIKQYAEKQSKNTQHKTEN
jgi:hypothetical protein